MACAEGQLQLKLDFLPLPGWRPMILLRIDYSHGIVEGNCPNSQRAGVFQKIRVMASAEGQLQLKLDFPPLPGWRLMIPLRID